MKRIAIIGAGISGLSIGQMLKDKYQVILFEGASRPGGLIKCERIKGNLFHTTGGHVFNTKRQDVADWFWSFFNKETEFTKAKRNASICMGGSDFIPYPIENYIHLLQEDLVKRIINDLLEINRNKGAKPTNFKEFLQGRFGETLFNLYFKPYNEKIWQCDLSNIPLSWLEGKLPMPTVEEILFSNIKNTEESNFVHSSFYYPKVNGSQFLVDRLAEGLNIVCNSKISSVKQIDKKWFINNQEFDAIIYCGNIKQLPSILESQKTINTFAKQIDALEYHGTTTVLCETEKNPYSWIYLPNPEIKSHRIICTGNFAESNNSNGKMSVTIEFTDEVSLNDIEENLNKLPFAPKYLAHHYEKFTYPIQNQNTSELISDIKQKLNADNFFLLGRFAEWEYYNMDVAIGAAIDLSKSL